MSNSHVIRDQINALQNVKNSLRKSQNRILESQLYYTNALKNALSQGVDQSVLLRYYNDYLQYNEKDLKEAVNHIENHDIPYITKQINTLEAIYNSI